MGCIQDAFSGSLLVGHSTAISICSSFLPCLSFLLCSLLFSVPVMQRGRPCHSESNSHAEYFQQHFLVSSRKVFYSFTKRTNLQLGFSVNTAQEISQTPIHFFSSIFPYPLRRYYFMYPTYEIQKTHFRILQLQKFNVWLGT